MSLTVGDAVAVLNRLFPPETAESWDHVGLAIGDVNAPCRKVLFAVDPCEATVREAIDGHADLLVTHHPLYLRGTHSVATTSAKGRWTAELIRHGVAQFSAHTNADVAASTRALAELFGVRLERPLSESGIGGVGTLAAPVTLREFAHRVADALPAVPAGILVGGDLDALVSTVALCSGSGDSFLDAANAAGADVYVTADLRHHPASDHLWNGGCALVCGTHWATEWPLLGLMEQWFRDGVRESYGSNVDTEISTTPTDPWVARLAAAPSYETMR
ncbi:MAG: Nif3-like dinuclear metal center hexameric protein [Ancrocorticia sp.]|jgi:dinuclear metal center YbgI/SA1388 family protein|nr:Nif3-like dinuclear metal center hexameric protein [Ancrocorticia sp.]MCI1932899.1 Nif3-like dinuclear metal center hexameric protein [Ancrocorticia sp.]MCI1963588.1 Nif3-like dinuclear metal center hexameric protein [Ancrocorticia sp.]MCI2002661.1 Nif3-like dinuclear metal center hexameric protein [Ancrocorticia sp.]MCI2013109.1 Nif3-like dinuclear metal center hexameric protein [Ancrocorticia sp.]